MSATAHARHDTEISCALARGEVPKANHFALTLLFIDGQDVYMCTLDLFNNQIYFSIVNHIKSKTRLDNQMLSACRSIRLALTKIPVSDRSMGAIKYFERK